MEENILGYSICTGARDGRILRIRFRNRIQGWFRIRFRPETLLEKTESRNLSYFKKIFNFFQIQQYDLLIFIQFEYFTLKIEDFFLAAT